MPRPTKNTPPQPARHQIARVYLRVSTLGQDLARQEKIVQDAIAAGYYVAAVYREQASGARAEREELLRMISDLQPGEVVIAEKIDRISRLPLEEAERLIESIREKGAKLAIPGVVDLSEIAAGSSGVARIVLESVQEMLLRLALQMARDEYETRRERQAQGIKLAKAAGKYKGRAKDENKRLAIIQLRRAGQSIAQTAKLVGCGKTLVKEVWAEEKAKTAM